jgi:TonB family protein
VIREVWLGVALAAAALTQQTAPVPSAAAPPTPGSEIHYAGPGVVAPELLPVDFPITPPAKCKKMNGTARVFVAVDAEGKPRQDYLLEALGNELDLMALRVAELSTFKPGTADGAPATVGIVDEVQMQACTTEEKVDGGLKRTHFMLRSLPAQRIELAERPAPPLQVPPPRKPKTDQDPLPIGVYRVGGEVSAPRILKFVDAQFSDEARRKKINGVCLIDLKVYEHGIPQNPRVVRPLGYGLDENALWAVMHFRFTPAMRHGEPVPVQITIQVSFKIY